MPTKLRVITFVITCAIGIASTSFRSALLPSIKGFSQAEAQAKLGRRVKWKANAVSVDEFINDGVVTDSAVLNGERLLVIDWDKKLAGMKHRSTLISRDDYNKIIVEDR